MILSASYAAHGKSLDLRQANFENNPSPCGSGWVGRIKKQWLLVMKLTAVLLLIACLQVSARGFGQGTVTLSLKNVAVTEVLREIEKQTSFRFLYRDELVKKAGPITITVKDATVQEALDKCFEKSKLEYKIFKETIVISEKGEDMNKGGGNGVFEMPTPPINVTGRVLNENKEPVTGASVQVKGTDKGTTTDADGYFTLKGVEENAVLVISAVNIETREIRLSGNSGLDITVNTRITESEAVTVVSTGYQDIPKERATGSFFKVDNDLVNRRISTNILDRLDGVASGLIFNKNRQVATNQSEISIRGRSTIFGNSDPLIVLDNFPYEDDINNINPNDVESITILKDAAAASIWGVRAGNGVIVITTKKGALNKRPTLNLTSALTISDKIDLYYQPQLTSSQFIEVEKFLFEKGKYNSTINNGYAPISSAVAIMLRMRNGEITEDEMNAQLAALAPVDIRSQIDKYYYRRPVYQQHSLSIGGGTESNKYYFSVGYDRNLDNLITGSFNRLTINAKNSYFLLDDKLELSTSIFFTNSSNKNSSDNYSPRSPYDKLVDENGKHLSVPKDYRELYTDTAGGGYLLDWKYKPLDENYANVKNRFSEYRANLNIAYKFLKNLKFSVNYQYGRGMNESGTDYTQESYYVRNQINRFSQLDRATGVVTRPVPLGGIITRSDRVYKLHNGRVQINYDANFGSAHRINAIAGAEIRHYEALQKGFGLYGYIFETASSIPVNYAEDYPVFYSVSAMNRIMNNIGQSASVDRFLSYYFNGSYSFKGKYVLSLSGRKDESNLFGVKANQKGVPLWSLGASWIISKEGFYSIGWLPRLQLRSTLGYNGNVDRTTSSLLTASRGTSSSGGINPWNLYYTQIDNPPNPSLRWEKVRVINLGLDFGFIKDRLNGSFEYYIKEGLDLIGNSPIAPQTGVAVFKGNSADLKTRGIDVVLNAKVLVGRNFEWNSNLLMSYVTDKITTYKVKQGSNFTIVTSNFVNPLEGFPYYSIFSFPWAGLDSLGNPLGYLNDHVSNNYSGIKNSTDDAQLIYNGPGSPTFFGGFRNTIAWKIIALSFNITYKSGHYFRRESLDNSSLYNGLYRQPDYDRRWQKSGDELVTTVPSLIYPANTHRTDFYKYSEVLVEKADHIRFQDIQFTIGMTQQMLRNLPVKSVKMDFYLNNIGVIWRANKRGLDPDSPNSAPVPKSYSIRLRIDF